VDGRLLAEERALIDAIDAHLVSLLLRRRAVAARIIQRRLAAGGAPRELSREHAICARIAPEATSEEEADYLRAIFRAVLDRAPVPDER